jgi:hypothetical protein
MRGRAPGSTKDDDEAKQAEAPAPGKSTLVDATAGAKPPAPVTPTPASDIKPDATAASTAVRKRQLDEDVGPRWSRLKTFQKRKHTGRDEDETKSDEDKEAETEDKDAVATEQAAADQESTTEKASASSAEAVMPAGTTSDPRPG